MSELLNTSYTIGITFLLVTMILKKIKKMEGIETDEISIDLINKYLSEIEKYLPEIREQLPELTKICLKNKINSMPNIEKNDNEQISHNNKTKHVKQIDKNDNDLAPDPNVSGEQGSEAISPHIADDQINHNNKTKHIKQIDKNSIECKNNDGYHKIYNDIYIKILSHKNNCDNITESECSSESDKCSSESDKCGSDANKCTSDSESDSDKCSTNSNSDKCSTNSNKCSSDFDKCSSDFDKCESVKCKSEDNFSEYECVENNKCNHCINDNNLNRQKSLEEYKKNNDIDDRIKKIKLQLDKLSDLEEEQCKEDNENDDCYNDKAYIEHIGNIECREISEEEEKNASNWDLCELRKKTYKPCKYECGKFAINEDLDIFKSKVIRKAEVIISCYKKKLLECAENKCNLEKCLQKCKKRNEILEKKLKKCYNFLNCCEGEKKNIMCKAKKCEKELACLLEKYYTLECEYGKKKRELDKCHNKNKHLLRELQYIKCELEKCLCNKNKLKK